MNAAVGGSRCEPETTHRRCVSAHMETTREAVEVQERADTRVSVLRADNGDEKKQNNKNMSTQRLNETAYGSEAVSHGF